MHRRKFLQTLASAAAPFALSLAPQWRPNETAWADEPAKPLLALGAEPKTVVCLGDSVTGVYYHTGGVRAYPELLEIALKKAAPGANVTVVNAGISGHTTENGLARLDRDVIEKKPHLTTVTFGLNDMARIAPDAYRENLKTIVARCRAAQSDVVLCTPNAVISTGGRPRDKLEQYCEIIRATAKEVSAPLCDIYAAYEARRKKDEWDWRLTLSDEIHPNLDGHKIMAETICKAITTKEVSLADLAPPPALAKSLAKLKKKEPVRVIVMPPFEEAVTNALKQIDPKARIEATSWAVEGKTLPQIMADAQTKIRAAKPDLVVIAVPRSAKAASDEEFVRSYLWVMNWSLSFGLQEWDCVVAHPSVAEPPKSDSGGSDPRDALVRRLVKGQDLWLIDREPAKPGTPARTAAEIMAEFLRKHAAS